MTVLELMNTLKTLLAEGDITEDSDCYVPIGGRDSNVTQVWANRENTIVIETDCRVDPQDVRLKAPRSLCKTCAATGKVYDEDDSYYGQECPTCYED